MKKSIIATLIMAATNVAIASDAHWGYSGHEGPEYWGELSPNYTTCSGGKNQSPVDISGQVEAELKPLGLDYKIGATQVVNNGHTIKVDYAPGSTLTVDGHSYELKQFHFHSPSENLIGSHSYPLEGHLVHADKEGNLAVVGVMFEEGDANVELQKVWSVMPHQKDGVAKPAAAISAEALLPKSRDYYRFNGSLTTPPCTEGVLWLVMKQPVKVSAEQVAAFETVMHHPNNRPVQPLNARAVMQ